MCVTHEIGGSCAWVDAMNGRGQDPGVCRALRANGIEGFPVQWIIRQSEEKFVTSFELVNFEKTSVPASALEIPAGYQKTDVMGVWSSPDQVKATQEIRKKALEDLTFEQRKKYEELLKSDRTPR